MAVISPSAETNEEEGHFGLQIEHHEMIQPKPIYSYNHS